MRWICAISKDYCGADDGIKSIYWFHECSLLSDFGAIEMQSKHRTIDKSDQMNVKRDYRFVKCVHKIAPSNGSIFHINNEHFDARSTRVLRMRTWREIEIANRIYAICDHHDCAKWKTAIN